MAHSSDDDAELQHAFDAAVAFIRAAPKDSAQMRLDNDTKLLFYGLYKRVVDGTPGAQKPSMFDRVAVAKHDAWTKAAAACPTPAAAMRAYVSRLDALAPSWRHAGGAGYTTPPVQSPSRAVGAPPRSSDSAAPAPAPLPTVSMNGTAAAVTPASQSGAMYADFTAASGATTQPRTPPSAARTVTPSIPTRAATAAAAAGGGGGVLGWLFSPSAVRDSIATSSVAATTSAALFMDDADGGEEGDDPAPRRAAGIRWSSSPNGLLRGEAASMLDASMHTVSLPSGAASEMGDVGTPQHRGPSVHQRASLLQARLSHEELGVMCAELEVNLAEQHARLEAVEAQLQSTWAATGRYSDDALAYVPDSSATRQSILSRLARSVLQALSAVDGFLARVLPVLPHNSLRNMLLFLAVLALVRLAVLRRAAGR